MLFVVISGVLSLLALAALVHYSRRPAAAAAVVLTTSSFDRFLAAHPAGVLVDFHKQGCPWCTKLAPEFEKAAQHLSGNREGVALASVDGGEEEALARRFNLERYPTVMWFRNGIGVQELPPMDRTSEKILEFVDWVRQPAMVNFETVAEFEEGLATLREALAGSSRPAVAVFAVDGGSAAAVAGVAAEKLRGKVAFMHVREAPAAGAPAARAFGASAEADKDYDGPLDADALEQWVKEMIG